MLRMGDIMLTAAILVIVAVLLGACGSIAPYFADDRPRAGVDGLREFEFKNNARLWPKESKPAPLGNVNDPVCAPEIKPTPEEC